MKRLILLTVLGAAGCGSKQSITVYLPDAAQGSEPFCISDRGSSDVRIPHGATIHPGQMIRASVVKDFEWGFTNPEPATDRQDVDCFVVAR